MGALHCIVLHGMACRHAIGTTRSPPATVVHELELRVLLNGHDACSL